MKRNKRKDRLASPAFGQAGPLPLPQEGDVRMTALPTPPEPADEMTPLPAPVEATSEAPPTSTEDAPDDVETKVKAKAASITRQALDYYVDRSRFHFTRLGNLGAALSIAGRELKERALEKDGVFHLRPETSIERYLRERVNGSGRSIGAPLEPPEVAEKRRAYDEAARSGDPDAMTRTANELLRAVETAKAKVGSHEAAQALAGEKVRDSISEILAPRSAATGMPGEVGAEVYPTARLPGSGPHTIDHSAGEGGVAVSNGEHRVLGEAHAKVAAQFVRRLPIDLQAQVLDEVGARYGVRVASQLADGLTASAADSEEETPSLGALEASPTRAGAQTNDTALKFLEAGDPRNWIAEFWNWLEGLFGGKSKGYQSPLPDEEYDVGQDVDLPLGSQLSSAPLNIQRDELEPPLDPNWSPSGTRYDPPDRWRRFRRHRPGAKAPAYANTPFAQTERGKVLIGIDELDAGRRSQLDRQRGTWMWPTNYPPSQEQLRQGLGYFGAPRGGVGAFHGGLDFAGDPDPNRETEVRLPTGARIVGVQESFHYKKDKNGNFVLDKNGNRIQISEGYTLSFDLGNGLRLELRHVKPTEELVVLGAALSLDGGRSSRFIPRGTVLGVIDRDAYEGRNDHVHVQVTMVGGSLNGQGVSGFAVDPTGLFDPNQAQRNRTGGGVTLP